MMALGHGLSGVCVGLFAYRELPSTPRMRLGADIAEAIGGHLPPSTGLALAGVVVAFLVALASAGAAVTPDLDHPGSTASTALGPLSRTAHRGVVALHHLACAALREPHDRSKPPGAHRGVTHWWPFPIVAGLVVTGACLVTPWSAAVVLAVLYTFGIHAVTVPEYRDNRRKSLRRRISARIAYRMVSLVPPIWVLRRARKTISRVGKVGVVAIASALAVLSVDLAPGWMPWLGALVTAGMWLHILGDAPTESGLPSLRSLLKNWRLPKWLAFKAGGPFEMALWAAMGVTAVLLTPVIGAWTWTHIVLALIGHVQQA